MEDLAIRALSAAPAGARDASEPLTAKNFRRLCTLVHDYCGIRLTAKKESMLEGRLRRRMRLLNIRSVNEYCRYLFDQEDAGTDSELARFIDAVTTTKTDFFREPAHFTYLQTHILPTLRNAQQRNINVWSAASSTGAEAYTIAMVIDDFFRDTGGVDFSILGTDICTDVLGRASIGCYPDAMLNPIPEEFRRRYVLVPTDSDRHEFRIAAKLRAKVSFQYLNLMDAHYPFDGNFDLIFLRNVLIYFDRPTQDRVLARLCEHIRPGGYLFLGHSESLAGAKLPLTMVANTIFQKR